MKAKCNNCGGGVTRNLAKLWAVAALMTPGCQSQTDVLPLGWSRVQVVNRTTTTLTDISFFVDNSHLTVNRLSIGECSEWMPVPYASRNCILRCNYLGKERIAKQVFGDTPDALLPSEDVAYVIVEVAGPSGASRLEVNLEPQVAERAKPPIRVRRSRGP